MVRSKFKAPAWIAPLLALALVGVACGGGDEPGQPPTTEPQRGPTGGDWSMSICEPESLIPQINAETCGSQVLKALFTPLIQFDLEGNAFNVVASDISSDDQTTWTVTLNEGWTFHDGTPVTADSFVDAWNWAAYGPNAAGNNYFFANIEGYDELNPAEGEDPAAEELSGLEVVSDTEFTVTLTAPFSEFPITVGYNAFYPLPEAFFEDQDAFNEQPVGNGPYMMEGAWEHNQFINVTKFEDYAGEPGNADNIEFRIYGDLDVAYRDVQAESLDIADVPDEQIESAQTEFGDRFVETPSSSFTYLGFPLYIDAFENPELRQAFSMAIDRQAIVTALFFNTRSPADDMVSPVVAGYREGACGENCTFDAAAAKAKFDAAGGYDGTLFLWFNSDGGHEGWMEAVSNQLRQNLGIQDIQFESLEFAEYLGKLDEGIDDDPGTEGVTGPFRLGWVMDYPSMQNYLEPIHGCGGSSNYTTYCNEEFDDLVEQGKSASTPEEAVSLYQQADDILLQDMPIIPLFFGLNQAVHSPRVDNVNIDKFSFVDVAGVQVVEQQP